MLAFVGPGEGGFEDLHLARSNGRAARPLAPSYGAPDGSPAWSPDGTRIAFSSRRDGNWEIYSVGVDGTGLRRLTHHAAFDGGPTWSPDGRWIAFTSDRAGGDSHLYRMRADGSGLRRLTYGDDESAPDWSPDGRWIAFAGFTKGNADIWLVSADGRELCRVTHDEDFEYSPRWSPDGELIAFEAYPNDASTPAIFVVASQGEAPRRVTRGSTYAGAADWVPAG